MEHTTVKINKTSDEKYYIQSKFHMKSLRKQKGTVWQNRVEFLWIHMHFECSSHYFKENA